MKGMKRYWFLGVVVIMALLFAGMTFANSQVGKDKQFPQSQVMPQKFTGKISPAEREVLAQQFAKEMRSNRISNAKKAANDLTPTRVQMRDQMSKNCSLQNPEGIALYWYGNQFSGGTYWVGTNGNAVIFNNGTDLSFADATDVNHPTVVDQVLLDFVYKGVFVGDTAYLLESQAIDIWDVSHPENPANLNWWLDCDAAYNTYAWYYDIVVRGDYAYLASDTDGLRICDVVNGTFKTPTASAGKSYYQVILNGNYLLAYDGSNIDVYDLTKPLEPVMVNSIMLAGYDQLIYSAPYLFAITYSDSATSQLDIYSLLNPVTGTISGPLNPAFLLPTPDSSTPIEYINCAVKDGDYIYFAGYYGAYVVNVSNATAPTLYKFIADNWLQGGASDGKNHPDTFGTWIDSANGVHILADCQGIISFDLTPAIKGRYIATSGLMGWYYKDAFSVNSDGSRFLANAVCEGVVLLDSDLVRLDFWELPNYYSFANSSNFSLDGTMAFVCWEDYTVPPPSTPSDPVPQHGVAILDLSNDHITFVKNYVPDPLKGEWVPLYAVPVNIGTHKYILVSEFSALSGNDRLELVDITSPANPLSVSIPIADGIYGDILKPAIAEGYTSGKIYAIVPLGFDGIVSVDITTPAAPIVNPAGALSMNGNYTLEVAISNANNHWFGFAAVDDSSHGIYVIDLADPFNMILKGYSENVGAGHWQVCLAPGGSPAPQIVAAETWSYYGDLYDASSPASPKYLAYFYDYGAYFGYPTWQVLAVPNGSNSMLYTTSYLGATQYLNTPDYTKPQVTGPFTITPTPSGTPPVIKDKVKLTVKGVSDDVGVTRVRFYAEDTCCNLYKLGDVVTPQADGTTYVFEFDPSNSPITGEVYLYARAYDAGNNATFYPARPGCFAGVPAIIMPKPEITITAPAVEPCGLVGLTNIKGTAYTVAGFITRIEVFIDGVSLGLAGVDPAYPTDTIPSTAGPVTVHWSIPWDTTTISDGDRIITAEVMVDDSVTPPVTWSTFKMSDDYPVKVTNDGPEIYVVTPAAGNVVGGSTVELTVNILRDDACITKVDYYLDGAKFKTATAAPWSATWDTTGVALGNHVLVATATDINGKTGNSPIVNLMVVQYTPMTLTATGTPTSGNAPLAVAFAATVTGGSAPFTYTWDFGDGQTGAGSAVTHTYTTAGSYTAKVTVTDATNATKDATVAITVTGGPVIENPVISSVKKASDPFRLHIYGSKFKPGCDVYIGTTKVATTTYKDSSHVVAKKGASLKALCPKGTQVMITVKNPDGGVSNEFPYTR
jgi:PKD repeat protein